MGFEDLSVAAQRCAYLYRGIPSCLQLVHMESRLPLAKESLLDLSVTHSELDPCKQELPQDLRYDEMESTLQSGLELT